MRAEPTTGSASDEQLYQRTLHGDTTAFEQLVDRYHSPLFRFLYRQTGDTMLAEDMLQETLTRLIVYQGPPPDQFRAWAYTVASNLARDHFRSAGYRREVDTPDHAILESPFGAADRHSMDDALMLTAEADAVAQALAQLTPEHRETVILRFYHDLPLADIASISGVPAGTIKSRLFHALRRLKGLLVSVGMDA